MNSPPPDSWEELMKMDHPIDFLSFMKSDLLASQRNFMKFLAIIHCTVCPISFLSSAAIIYHILRSHKGLFSIYHRLVFGLCVSDMISSFAGTLSTFVAPKEMKYELPFARGNVELCTLQGFLVGVGFTCTNIYSCSICFYYLAIVRYNKNERYIRERLEPWLHGMALLFTVLVASIGIPLKGFNNPNRVICLPEPYNPPHCIGYEDGFIPNGFSIPCGRGGNAQSVLLVGNILNGICTPIVIIGSMTILYRSVRENEKKMQRYGVGALRLATNRQQVRNTDDESTTESCNLGGTIRTAFIRIFSCFCRNRPVSRSNRATSQKRAILQMAMGYSLAWGAIWLPLIFMIFWPGNISQLMIALFSTERGLYNLIVYMAPKVRSAKASKRGKLTWCQAISKAWMSKGEMRRSLKGKGKAGSSKPLSRRWMEIMKKADRLSTAGANANFNSEMIRRDPHNLPSVTSLLPRSTNLESNLRDRTIKQSNEGNCKVRLNGILDKEEDFIKERNDVEDISLPSGVERV